METCQNKDKNDNKDKWTFPSIMFGGCLFVCFFSVIGVFEGANLAICVGFLPVLLILAGVNAIFGKKSPTISRAIGVSTLVMFLVLMVIGPGIGLIPDRERTVTELNEPIADTETYTLDLKAGLEEIWLTALEDSPNLLEARISHYGMLNVEIDGDTEKTIRIEQQDENTFGFDVPFGLFENNGEDTGRWNIALSQHRPVMLKLDGGIGSLNMDLARLWLTELDINLGIGGFEIDLPEPRENSYLVTMDGGIGGGILTLPRGAAVRLIADLGVGGVDVGDSMQRMDNNDDFVGVDGLWETVNFEESENRITIEYDGGVGGLEVQFE